MAGTMFVVPFLKDVWDKGHPEICHVPADIFLRNTVQICTNPHLYEYQKVKYESPFSTGTPAFPHTTQNKNASSSVLHIHQMRSNITPCPRYNHVYVCPKLNLFRF